MVRFDEIRWLPALALLALCPALAAQEQVAPTVQPTAKPEAQALPAAPTAPLANLPAAPAPPPTQEQIGDALAVHQRYQAAIAAYAKAPRDSASLLNKMGIAYQMMFNLSDAIRCYKASLKINPRDPNVLNNLGTVYDSLKQYGQAERMYRRALKLEPHSAIVYKNLGSGLFAQHNYRKGAEAYRQALAIDPQIFQDRSSPKVQNPASTKERGAMNYYMARGCARSGLTDCALQYLRIALNEGYTTAKKLAADNDFANLRGLPAFQQLLAAQHSQ